MSAPDLAAPLRTAIVGATAITSLLTAYKNSFPVFTRRPAPTDAPPIIIMISPDIAKTDEDGLSDERPVILRDVSVFGPNNDAEPYRDVETIAGHVFDLFHRNRNAITVPGWHVVAITATGPIPAPTDDDQTVARLVTLRIQLARQ